MYKFCSRVQDRERRARRRSDAAADKADCARADLMAALILLAGAATQGAVELTSSNFESKIGSKHAFVKFLAPW